MLFNVEHDFGDRIVGYIVPDGFSETPRLRVVVNGEVIARFSAQEERSALVTAGRHETGRCGFLVDETLAPGLSGLQNIEILEDSTGLLIYRRLQPDHILRKMVRFETHVLPLWRIDEKLRPHFQHHVQGAEFQGLETVLQHFHLNHSPSLYLAGRIGHRSISYLLDETYDPWCLLHDPFDELAERLLVLRKIHEDEFDLLGPRDGPRFAEVARFAAGLPLSSPRALVRGLRAIPPELGIVLSNPLTRQLTASTPDEMPTGAAVGAALDALSTFKVVGLRNDPEHGVNAISELMALPEGYLPVPKLIAGTLELAAALREAGIFEIILEKDLEVYHVVLSAAGGRPKANGQGL